MNILRSVFDFGRPEARVRAFLVLLVATLVSPNIPTPDPLPVLRLEQFALAVLLPSLLWYVWRHREARGVGLLDLAFALFAALMTLTLLLAPVLVSDVGYNVRDVFELARIGEYWLLFRLGLTVPVDAATFRTATATLLAGTIGLGIFALLQYLAPGDFNGSITTHWTTGHNLEGLERRGRALGTTGNANYFGILSGFFLVLALGVVLLRQRLGPGVWTWLAPVAVFAATLSLVMSQSRTATFAMLGAMFLGLLLIAWQWRGRAAYGQAIGLFLAAVIVAVTFVEAVPPQFGTFHERFAPAALTEDSSVSIRISKWRSVFGGFFESRPDFCQGEPLETRPIAGGHEIESGTGAEEASPEAIARDEQRKEDVAIMAGGVVDYFCQNDRWPADESLDEALVPEFLDTMPTDPESGEPYPAYITSSGITLGAELENEADPEGPIYTLTTIPNFVLNPSFESGNGEPNNWSTTGSGGEDARAELVDGGIFGEQAVDVAFPPGGNLRQNIVYEFPLETEYTASTWVRSTSGEEETVQIYLVAQQTDGTVEDPYAQTEVTVPGDGRWLHADLQFETSEESRIHLLRYLVRTPHEGSEASVQLDGVALTRGPFPASFHRLTEVDPASLAPDDVPGVADSPFIGVGPRHDFELGSVDNEYVLILERYGLLGTLAYLALWLTAFAAAWRAWSRGGPLASTLALAIMVFTIALAVFNVAAGSLYHFQIMALYWLLMGLLVHAARSGGPAEEREP